MKTAKEWLEKYYPVKPNSLMTQEEALNHSLKKWEGLDCSTLSEYRLTKMANTIYEGDKKVISINGETCALCVLYYDTTTQDGEYDICGECPLRIKTGFVCDDTFSPYDFWCRNVSNTRMTKALRNCLED